MPDKSESMFGAASPIKSWTGEPQEHTKMSPPLESTQGRFLKSEVHGVAHPGNKEGIWTSYTTAVQDWMCIRRTLLLVE
jgi:hypothetical protein